MVMASNDKVNAATNFTARPAAWSPTMVWLLGPEEPQGPQRRDYMF